MDYQLQIKPFERKDGLKYKIIKLTDISFHSSKRQPTKSIGKKVRQAFERDEPGRFYGLMTQELVKSGNLVKAISEYIARDLDFLKMVQEEEKKGYKILLELPKDRIPFRLGGDTVEFLQSKNGQRIVRYLNNTNN